MAIAEWCRYLPPVEDLSVFKTSNIKRKLKEVKEAMRDLNDYLDSLDHGIQFMSVLLCLYEAYSSSEIEDVLIKMEDLFKSCLEPDKDWNNDILFVRNNYNALRVGYKAIDKSHLIRYSDIINSHNYLLGYKSDVRDKPGTVIASGNFVVHNPPQSKDTILRLLKDLLEYINIKSKLDLDKYIKLAIYHSQFEAIHPFFDGNGRMGRVLNMMYLYKAHCIKHPVFYLSRYFSDNRSEYYMLLNHVSNGTEWETWTLFMLDAILSSAELTKTMVQDVMKLWNNKSKYFGNIDNELAQSVFYTGKLLS